MQNLINSQIKVKKLMAKMIAGTSTLNLLKYAHQIMIIQHWFLKNYLIFTKSNKQHLSQVTRTDNCC